MSDGDPSRRHLVTVFIRDGVPLMELGLVHQIFGQARGANGYALYEVRTCASRPGGVRTDADFSVVVPHGARALRDSNTVIIPAAYEQDHSGEPLSAAVASAVRQIRPGARIASIGTGAFVLAAAGILDGRRATTHWRSIDLFRRRYPPVLLNPGLLFVDEGDVLTSADEASGIDMCLHIVRRDHGRAVADEVALRMVVAPYREGGHAQFIRRLAPETEPSSAITATIGWALAHLDEPLTLEELADRASVSVRTLTRRFRHEVGMPPLEWIIQQRVERARRLLEETDATVDRIAAQAGFGTAAGMRQHFARHLNLSPSAYRSTFQGARR